MNEEYRESKIELQMAKQGFEILALTLLVSTPSGLNNAWMAAQSAADAVKALDGLNFSTPAKAAAAQFLTKHFESRAVFFGFGKLHAEFYGGSGEHPPGPGTKPGINDIIAALQALDLARSAKQEVCDE
jgi:hypothetical protein